MKFQSQKVSLHFSFSFVLRTLILLSLTFYGVAFAQKPTTKPTKTQKQQVKNKRPSKLQKITEKLLIHLRKNQYNKVYSMMAPIIKKSLSQKQLSKQFKLIRSIIGPYQPNTLQLTHHKIIRGKHRLIWAATFQKEVGTVWVILSSKMEVGGLIIQSPTLQKRLRKEEKLSSLSAKRMKQIEMILEQLMQGYNQKNWSLFCKSCNRVMKNVFQPPQFQRLQKRLNQKYGKYQGKKKLHFRKMSISGMIVARYLGTFKKNKRVLIQLALKDLGSSYQLVGWRLVPQRTKP